jgi:hydroxyacylglutathione hydrolase
MNKIKILPLPAFNDNYIWLLYDEITHDAWAVDPGDATPVIKTLKQYDLHLKGILVTHHHHDHTDGIASLLKYTTDIFGSHISAIPHITHPVKEGDQINSSFFKLTVTEIPGHTLDHIAFHNEDIIFCGDTLFSMGCGKVFEGTPAQMYHSLNKLSQLSEQASIYCGHEYTLANLAFAQMVEPSNTDLSDKINAIKTQRAAGLPSLPAPLSIEKKLNPFLRCDQPSIISAVETHYHKKLNNPVDVFSHLRAWKNTL